MGSHFFQAGRGAVVVMATLLICTLTSLVDANEWASKQHRHAKNHRHRSKCMIGGWCDCDGNKHNGCEVNIRNDAANCGKCGNVCPVAANATTSCVRGHCSLACFTGLANCAGGCTDLKTDLRNCGSCSNVCPASANSSATCVDGECGLSGCFPGDARVTLETGAVKQMVDLELGDKVAVKRSDGSLAYEDVYAFGHNDPSAYSTFVQLTVESIAGHRRGISGADDSRTLELTALHFIPILSGITGKRTYKRAEDVEKGDKVWVEEEGGVARVSSIAKVEKRGLYNPFSLGGNIVVNGVVASCHSDWFLDSLFHALGLLHWLPATYQMVLMPVRLLYSGLGKHAYIRLYLWVESFTPIPCAILWVPCLFFTIMSVY